MSKKPRVVGDLGAAPAGDDFAAELRAAVRRGQLRLVYQPEVDLRTGAIVAVEALVRWEHPRLGELGPAWFIPLAERSNLINIVGEWVLAEAIATLASWNTALPGLAVVLRVNVSPVQLTGARIVAPVAAALRRHGVPGKQLCVELTENVPLGDLDEVCQAIEALRELGVTSAIDDLATGYSALSHLRTLNVDQVKIDRSLVSGIDSDARARTILAAVVGLARDLDIGVIAEGVETPAEARTVLDLGCTRAQGHHFGRPVDGAAFAELLRDQ